VASPTTAVTGAPSHRSGSSERRSSPTGLPIESEPSSEGGVELPEPAAAEARRRTNGRRSNPGSERATTGSGRGAKGKRRVARPGRKLLSFDRGLGVRFVAGADEAGRGCLAGPLVAAAVLLDLERIGPAQARALGALNDSKQQTPEGRAKLYPVIMEIAARACIVSRCAPGIDARGLHRTNLQALRDALARVAVPGCICLSDGFPVAHLGHDQRAVVGGDAKSAAIAAASVLAKETRDRYMRRADAHHPGWEFAQHVGYSTPEHRQAIERLGVSPLHRMSFQSMAYQQLELA
jgi:ribonuclease HII